MPSNPNNLLDLLKDIDFTNPQNDVQQLDILFENIQKSKASEKIFVPTKSAKVFQEITKTNENLKRRFEMKKPQKTEIPEFEVEKTHSSILNTSLHLHQLDLSSKFTTPDKVLGPFTAIDDLPVIFNFYKYIDDFKIFFPNDLKAAFIIPVRLRNHVVINTRSNLLTLNKGNIWIRADLLDAKAPKTNYVGLKITGGQITLGNTFPIKDNSITVPVSSRFEADYTLDNSYQGEVSSTDVGIDAKKAVFNPPSTLKLTYFNSKINIASMDALFGSCFGWQSYIRGKEKQFIWDAENRALLLNLAVEQPVFEVSLCESKFYTLNGKTQISSAQWMLPSRVLNNNKSLEVKFNGALRLSLETGLSADWDGIRHTDNSISLNACTLTYFNGDINLIGKNTDFKLLHEHYTLWQKSKEKPYKMELDLNFSKHSTFVLVSQSIGDEFISANADSDFLIDKPVRADNRPIHPTTKKSIYAKGISKEERIVILSDTDLINETDDPSISSDVTLHQFVLENAYFTTSKEVTAVLNAKWNTENHLYEGKLRFNYFLYDFLPMLPHPYTTNQLPKIIRTVKGHDIFYEQVGTLQTNIIWQTEEEFTASEIDFKLNQQKFNGRGKKDTFFSLLDVSTESDHWGVSLNFENMKLLQHTFEENINITEENVVTISRNSLHAPMALLNGFTLPQVSWEPVVNMLSDNPDDGFSNKFLVQKNNSICTVFSQFSNQLTSINPKNYLRRFRVNLKSRKGILNTDTLSSRITFSLPNGKKATISLSPYLGSKMTNDKHLEFIDPKFIDRGQSFLGSLQFRVAASELPDGKAPLMEGSTFQKETVESYGGYKSILGQSVTALFNGVFNETQKKVPLTHIDFSGYGASTFSNWKDPNVKFAGVAQVKFDLLKGRTAHEIVQVVSMIYPWGINTTRTVTFLRNNNAVIFREDSGWVAQSDGLFDFSYSSDSNSQNGVPEHPNPYEIYQGLVEGLYNITNIREDRSDIITDANSFELIAVYFDADVKLNAVDQLVTGKQFKGYLQLKPIGAPLEDYQIKNMFDRNNDRIGGSIDTTFNIEKTLQKFKANRVEVSVTQKEDDQSYNQIMVCSVKGSPILPAEGSWSVVEIDEATGDVSNLEVGTSVGLIKEGMRPQYLMGAFVSNEARSLLKHPNSFKKTAETQKNYAFLQNTDTQKLLLRSPEFVNGLSDQFETKPALLADCFRLMNSKGPFPNFSQVITIDGATNTVMGLLPEGIKKVFNYEVPDQFSFNIIGNEGDSFRIYVKYDSSDPEGNNTKKSVIDFVTDSSSVDQWTNKMHSITIGVDLLGFKPIMYVTGDFGNAKKIQPSLELGHGPQLKLDPLLHKVYEVLEFLNNLDVSQPSEAIKKGLKIAMSNSADSWEYKFKADKEIPLVKFPFDPINYNAPTTPLKMDAFFKLGVYFNQPIKIPNNIDQIKPSVGAYMELGANIRVMCVSLAAATIYAQGRAEVGLYADLNTPPTLHFKFGFGVELCVGLPVIGSVSVTYMVGIDMKINADLVDVGAFIYFRGRVEIFGGVVTVAISIEAAGKIVKEIAGPTNCVAMCTFALDISIAFVININFTETWQETRQIS